VTLDDVVGLPVVLGVDRLGPPASTLQAAGSSASAFATAMQAGNPAGAITALIDAPAVIANGLLNGQATFPYSLNLSNLTAPVLGGLVNSSRLLRGDGDGHKCSWLLTFQPWTAAVQGGLRKALPSQVFRILDRALV
jgi:hypothetical protein